MYLIEISDDYPENYWLEYDSENYPDALLFKEGKLIDLNNLPTIYLNADSSASIKNLLSYDCLFSSGPELISERLAKILAPKENEMVQLVPVRIKHKKNIYEGFYIVNFLVIKKSFDMEKCERAPVIKSMPDGPKKFTKIVLLESDEENLIFRAEESLSEVVVTNDLAQKITSAKTKGIKLIKEKVRF